MIAVILAGGSGTRLWPLSVPDYPKHLLKVNDDRFSLLQRTVARARKLTDKIYVVSEQSHIDHVRQQLPDLPDEAFIIEPERRGTANCLALALGYMSNQQLDPDEPIVSMHADHYIRDTNGFRYTFVCADEISRHFEKLTLVGSEPTYAATGFGYIEKGDIVKNKVVAYEVKSFKEKPKRAAAQRYLSEGKYLWNCGYFVASLRIFENAMKTHAPELHANYLKLRTLSAQKLAEAYKQLTPMAIDYALIEKMSDLLVLQAQFDSMDLGSFADLAAVTSIDEAGNHVEGIVSLEDVKNSFIHNKEAKPLAVIGIDNCVVINTPEGILITRKDLSQKVGEIIKHLPKT